MAIERQMAGASPDRFGNMSSEAPGANIEAQFRQFYLPLEGEGAQRPIDALLRTLSDINTNLQIAATRPAEAAAANATLVQHLATLRATASRFPPPFDAMIRQAVVDFEADATGTTVSSVQQALGDQVTRVCQQIVTNRYPFERRSEREVPLADFARLFAPGGILDRFFKDNLEQYVDRSKQPWAWRLDSRVARALSPGTLREFQRAAEIRDAFFPTGGNTPSFTMSVTPLTLSGDAATAKFEINGTPVSSQQGVNAPVNVQWPGGGIGRTAITLTLGGGGGGGGFFGGGFFSPQAIMLERQGTWSFFRVLDAGSLLKQGDGVVATFVIGGRELSYQFNVGSLANPLVLQALREFRCPSGI
jgi:type VI secretion system protein ImpL